jgi:hypothetical protein
MSKPCNLLIQFSNFDSNVAQIEGGAIKWDFFEPLDLLSTNNFTNNTAQVYGNDIASVAKYLLPINSLKDGMIPLQKQLE